MKYEDFLKTKIKLHNNHGFKIKNIELNDKLFDFQKEIVKWALQKGSCAIFADCGLGKTPMQLEWANQIHKKYNKPIIIFAPLAVSKQTKREGEKFNINVTVCRHQEDISNGINITNYEMLQYFNFEKFVGIIIDESSILKGYDGKFRKTITEFAKKIPFKLACTATPSPNDIKEIINHADFLNIMTEKEILALYFIQDGNTSHKWKLKQYAINDFYTWLSSWSVALRKPSDLGFNDESFILPKLNIIQETIKSTPQKGHLFLVKAVTMDQRRKARTRSLDKKIEKCRELINSNNDQCLIWCDLNKESELLKNNIDGAVEIKGSDSIHHKEKSMLDFQQGNIRILITKPSIAGFGMNWQNCHNMIFVGLSDSFERLYQATRRCWRFGQTKNVNAYHIISEEEGNVVENIKRKEKEANILFDEIIKKMNLSGQLKIEEDINMNDDYKKIQKENYTAYLGDSVYTIDNIKNDSIGLIIFSPPFPSMYVYTDSMNDMGNVKNINEMIDQYRYLARKMIRVLMPGRSCCVHLCQSVAFKNQDGYIGIKDFRGKMIETMESEGWIYYGEVCIDKDPQVKAIRTKDRGLLFKTLTYDSCLLHMALADYLIQFRKPGNNPEPIKAGQGGRYNGQGWITPDEWIEWAAPVWYRKNEFYPGGIKETDVLQYRQTKTEKDVKHLCPLQLGVIERAIKLWSNSRDIVYSPFMGIGSEGYMALKLKRKFIGGELKEEYYNQAIRNLDSAETSIDERQLKLFA